MTNNIEQYAKYLAKWILNNVKINNFNGVCFGISGGIDSAVIYSLIKKYTNLKTICPFLKIENQKEDINFAKLIKKDLQIIDLTSQYKQIVSLLNCKKSISKNNLKVRLRMLCLYALAQENNYLVISTTNADEYLMGYFTKFGDIAGDIHPLIKLTKNQIYDLANLLKINQKIIKRNPTSGLSKLNDEQEMNVSYSSIDNYLLNKKIKLNDLKTINCWKIKSQHKKVLINKPKEYIKLKKY